MTLEETRLQLKQDLRALRVELGRSLVGRLILRLFGRYLRYE